MAHRAVQEKGVAGRRLTILVLVVALVALLAGCGGGEEDKGLTAPTEDTEIVEQTTATTQAPPRAEAAATAKAGTSNAIMVDPNSPVPPDQQIESFRLGCQSFKAQQ